MCVSLSQSAVNAKGRTSSADIHFYIYICIYINRSTAPITPKEHPDYFMQNGHD